MCVALQYIVNCKRALWTVWAVGSGERQVSGRHRPWVPHGTPHPGPCGAGAVSTETGLWYLPVLTCTACKARWSYSWAFTQEKWKHRSTQNLSQPRFSHVVSTQGNTVKYPHSEMLLSHKGDQNTDTLNIRESQSIVLSEVRGTKEHLWNRFVYLKP